MTERYLRLYFLTDANKNASIKVPNAAVLIIPAEVKDAMDEIAAGGMFGNNNGVFTEAKRAALTERETIEFDVV